MITFLDSINTTYNTGLLINLWMITSWRYANSNEDSNSKPICDKIIITSFTDAHISFLAAWHDNLQESPHISSSGNLVCTTLKIWTHYIAPQSNKHGRPENYIQMSIIHCITEKKKQILPCSLFLYIHLLPSSVITLSLPKAALTKPLTNDAAKFCLAESTWPPLGPNDGPVGIKMVRS